jgi:hypothetical protein
MKPKAPTQSYERPRYVSIPMLHLVRCHSQARGPARAVLLALSFYANEQTQKCWPNIDTICEESGWCRDAVFAAIKELQALGEIEVTRRGQKGNLYTITLEAPPKPMTEYEKIVDFDLQRQQVDDEIAERQAQDEAIREARRARMATVA